MSDLRGKTASVLTQSTSACRGWAACRLSVSVARSTSRVEMRHLLFGTELYALPILRPLAAEIAAWQAALWAAQRTGADVQAPAIAAAASG